MACGYDLAQFAERGNLRPVPRFCVFSCALVIRNLVYHKVVHAWKHRYVYFQPSLDPYRNVNNNFGLAVASPPGSSDLKPFHPYGDWQFIWEIILLVCHESTVSRHHLISSYRPIRTLDCAIVAHHHQALTCNDSCMYDVTPSCGSTSARILPSAPHTRHSHAINSINMNRRCAEAIVNQEQCAILVNADFRCQIIRQQTTAQL